MFTKKRIIALIILFLPPVTPTVAGVVSSTVARLEDEKKIRDTAEFLFSSPSAPGFIAVGTAEGTRTRDGGQTSLYAHHEDPGNRANNMGTCSWQTGGASTPKEADQRCKERLLNETLPMAIASARENGVTMTTEQLVIVMDAAVQAPLAANDFFKHLASEKCKNWKRHEPPDNNNSELISDPEHCARVNSFFNPKTQTWDVTDIFKPKGALEHDQWRRIEEIRETLRKHNIS